MFTSIVNKVSGIFVIAILFVFSGSTNASHFRSGHINWKHVSGNTVEFSVQSAWRRGFFRGACIDPGAGSSTSCRGAGNVPDVGDLVRDWDFYLNTGDGSTIRAYFYVTAVDPVTDWMFGDFINPGSLPSIDSALVYTYDISGNYTASFSSCCRIGNGSGYRHINNPDGSYRVHALVNVGSANSSPVSLMPPIVRCARNSTCSVPVLSSDPDGDGIRYRLATAAEAGPGFVQPGPTHARALSIDGVTGLMQWDTRGAALAPGALTTYYSTQIVLEDATSSVVSDFLIEVSREDLNPPVFSSPSCGSTQTVVAGINYTLPVDAKDIDATDSITLNALGLPIGSAMSPGLPIFGNPVTSTFNWNPSSSQVGTHLVSFTANSSGGGSALCSLTFEVINVQAMIIDADDDGFDDDRDGRRNGIIPFRVGSELTLKTGNRQAHLFELTSAFPFNVAQFLNGQIRERQLKRVVGLAGVTASDTHRLVGRRYCAVVMEVEMERGRAELEDREGLFAFRVLSANGKKVKVVVEDARTTCAALGVTL